VTCGHPFQDRVSVDNDFAIIEGYMDPALEGTVLSFDCPPHYHLIGPNTATCMENGEWEPDPRKVECKGIMLCYTIVIITSSTLLEAWECDYAYG
jgi:hypothetical protein